MATTTPRHAFYETDEILTLSIFVKGANADDVSVAFEPRTFTFKYAESTSLILSPLKGEIDPEKSDFTIGKVKVEVRLVKKVLGRWSALVADESEAAILTSPLDASSLPTTVTKKPHKNWEQVTDTIIKAEPDKTTNEDPNAGGDAALNGFFQQLFSGADEDTKRAMMKSYTESGGTALSTNWDEVKKAKVEVKPPEGSEWKKWN